MFERLTEKALGCFEYDLKNHKHEVGEFATYDAFFNYSMAVRQLGKYEDSELTPEEVQELAKTQTEGRLVVLPCKVGDLLDKYRELTRPKGDEAETYTTGYQNGNRNGQAELLAYLLQIDTGVREAAEKALGGGEG